MFNPFRAHAHHYEKNHRDSIGANVRPAFIETPGGGEEPGVMLGNGSRVLLILTVSDAYRIAKDAAKRAIDVFTPKIGSDGHTATLYDAGGWLPPGFSLVENRSRRPEPILTGSQWDDLQSAVAENRGALDGPVVVNIYDRDDVLIGTIDGRIAAATSSVSARSLKDHLGV